MTNKKYKTPNGKPVYKGIVWYNYFAIKELVENPDSIYWDYDLDTFHATEDGTVFAHTGFSTVGDTSEDYELDDEDEMGYYGGDETKFERLLRRFGSDVLKYFRYRKDKAELASKLGLNDTPETRERYGVKKVSIEKLIKDYSTVDFRTKKSRGTTKARKFYKARFNKEPGNDF